MKIYNGTPHSVDLISKESCYYDKHIRKWVSDKPTYICKIPTDGILSAKITTKFNTMFSGIPIYDKVITDCDPLPEGYDVVIVSALYASAYSMIKKDTLKLYTIADPVYSTDGKTILGALGICPYF